MPVLSLAVLLGLIFRNSGQSADSGLVKLVVSLGYCAFAFSSSKISGKILTLPLEFYDENNPDALPDELLEVLKTIPGLTRKWQDN